MQKTKPLLIKISVTLCAAAILALLAVFLSDTGEWYQNLEKPLFPPDWVFIVMPSVCMAFGAASAIVFWSKKGNWFYTMPPYALIGALITFWHFIFFQKQSLMPALLLMLADSILLIILLIKVKKLCPVAAYLLIPCIIASAATLFLSYIAALLN